MISDTNNEFLVRATPMLLLHNAYAPVAVYPLGKNLTRQRTQISSTANMALSSVFNRIHYLVAL